MQRARISHIAVIGKLHVLSEVQSLDSSDIPEIKEPDIGQDFALKDKSCNNSAENINVDLEIRCCVYNGQLKEKEKNE